MAARCSLAGRLSWLSSQRRWSSLDEVLAAGVLVLVPGLFPPQIQFADPLTRAAVYDDPSPSGRRHLHLAPAQLTDGPESLAHRVAAASRLRIARELPEPLGARLLLTRCDVELSACGVRGAHAAGTEDLGLTPREAAVAALMAAGRSNREAGAEL